MNVLKRENSCTPRANIWRIKGLVPSQNMVLQQKVRNNAGFMGLVLSWRRRTLVISFCDLKSCTAEDIGPPWHFPPSCTYANIHHQNPLRWLTCAYGRLFENENCGGSSPVDSQNRAWSRSGCVGIETPNFHPPPTFAVLPAWSFSPNLALFSNNMQTSLTPSLGLCGYRMRSYRVTRQVL